MNFRQALNQIAAILAQNAELSSRGVIGTESEQILIAAYRKTGGSQLTRMELFGRGAEEFTPAAWTIAEGVARSRAAGQPLDHLIGYKFFFEHEYEVSSDVLVPRPETELLVSLAIEALEKDQRQGRPALLGLEIGVGSGAISIELLAHFFGLRMIASELSSAAEVIARRNAEKILGSAGEPRLEIRRAHEALHVWQPFESPAAGQVSSSFAVARNVDLIVSNPPYLEASDPIDEEVIRHEPHQALFGPEEDSIHFYRQIALRAPDFLRAGGRVFVEIPPERAEAIGALFGEDRWQTLIHCDLNGRQRVIAAKLLP